MRRMIIAGVIFVLISVLWLWEQGSLKNVCNDMAARLEETETFIEKNDYEKALEKTEELKRFWKRQENTLDVLIRHDDTDDITLDIEVLMRYIQLKDATLSLSTIDELNGQFREIREKMKIHYTNIF